MGTKSRKDTAKNAAVPAAGQVFIRDEELKGFAIRILASGMKSYVFEARVKGRPRRMTLGPCSALSAAEAREKATKMPQAILDGHDPSADRANARAEPVFAEIVKEYFERQQGHLAPRTLEEYAKSLNCHMPKSWNGRKLSDISHDDLSRLHSTVGQQGPYAANRLIRALSTIFNCAREWGRLPKASANPVTGIKFFKETKRRRVLSPEEFRRVSDALAQEGPYWEAFFALALLLAVRSDNLMSARWEDFKLSTDFPIWSIPTTKSGEPHQLPLTPPAVAILSNLQSSGYSEWVFPSERSESGHLEEPKKAWARIRNRAGVGGIPDKPGSAVRIHDLRRTHASMLVGSGYSLAMIGAVLAHTDPRTTAGYAWMQQSPMRAALENNAVKMMALGLPSPVDSEVDEAGAHFGLVAEG